MKKWIILFLIIFFSFQVFGLTDVTPTGTTTQPQTTTQVCIIDPSVLARISVIESKLGTAPTIEVIQGMFNQSLTLIGNAMDEQEARILIIVIVANLCTVGIILAILFYLKSQRRL